MSKTARRFHHVAVLMGGLSAEREVSLNSGEACAKALESAGYKVYIVNELGGSYEEAPANLIEYAKRDRRWCQGNLQHLRIVFAQGLALPSRLHLAMGIMSYVSSPLWLALLVVSVADMMSGFRCMSFAGISRSCRSISQRK